MKSLRVKAWFKATPQTVIMDNQRAVNLGTKNLGKLVSVARKHKTNIIINSQPTKAFINQLAIKESDSGEYASLIKAVGTPVAIIKGQ